MSILWNEPTEDQRHEYATWTAERPECVRVLAERFNPWTKYKLQQTGQLCRVVSFHENEPHLGVLSTVCILAEHPTLGEITRVKVVGIKPDDLLPWTQDDEDAMNKSKFVGEGFMIDMVVESIDKERGTVTVSSGVKRRRK